MQNVLVTGGAGYIGSHACKALADAGYVPVTIDNLCLGNRDFVRWGPLVEADIRQTACVAETIRKYNVVGVMHFAAYAYVGESVIDPAKYYENNVVGLLSLLSAMRQTKRNKLILSSTCAVYGEPETIPVSEVTPAEPINPYGRSKLMCEVILSDFATAYGIEHICLRYFNASGADPNGALGEKRTVETHLIPRAMMYLRGHLDEFSVHGDDFPTDDGTAVRDYIHVCDLADAHVLAMQRLLHGGEGGVFNLGLGAGYSVMEVLREIGRVSNRPFKPVSGPRRKGDPPTLIADVALAREKLGFAPKYSDLSTIVETAWRWHSVAHPQI